MTTDSADNDRTHLVHRLNSEHQRAEALDAEVTRLRVENKTMFDNLTACQERGSTLMIEHQARGALITKLYAVYDAAKRTNDAFMSGDMGAMVMSVGELQNALEAGKAKE